MLALTTDFLFLSIIHHGCFYFFCQDIFIWGIEFIDMGIGGAMKRNVLKGICSSKMEKKKNNDIREDQIFFLQDIKTIYYTATERV
uniref:Uncharacterized protein n=1 Tax=Engystomops pustulosus TaxID=76066 RepID=A0AAV6YUK6_ENGPU|nr:hypothetical protein GDO81_018958 [Engystomops pustulosus]